MIRKEVIVKWEDGLDARPIALLVQKASQYDSQVYIEIENKKISAKSIMGMMSLKIAEGETVAVVAEGTDEDVAVDGIQAFLLNEDE
jgi:Phosphotransferase System HPr (HPr) Family